MSKKLTVKQQRFVDCYAGNGVEAARKAGYRGNANTLHTVAAENMRKPTILAAIQVRQEVERHPLIMDRQARQIMWSGIARDESKDISSRLRASELLGRSEGDFLERVAHSGQVEIVPIPKFDDPAEWYEYVKSNQQRH